MSKIEGLTEPEVNNPTVNAMEVESQPDSSAADNALKRDRGEDVENEDIIEAKKLKADKPEEENPVKDMTGGEKVAAPEPVLKEKLVKETTEGENVAAPKDVVEENPSEGEKLAAVETVMEEKVNGVMVGPKTFGSSVEAYDYFYKFLHHWTPHINVNKYEHAMLLALLKNGHAESDKKIGVGIKAFQVRFHPLYRSRCFFLVREDGSEDDFSFRKCVDHISPLPENMQAKQDVNKALGGRHGGRGGRGRGRGYGHGRGRGRGGN